MGSDQYTKEYTPEQKALFEARFRKGVDQKNPVAVKSYLSMYANPVINQKRILEAL